MNAEFSAATKNAEFIHFKPTRKEQGPLSRRTLYYKKQDCAAYQSNPATIVYKKNAGVCPVPRHIPRKPDPWHRDWVETKGRN